MHNWVFHKIAFLLGRVYPQPHMLNIDYFERYLTHKCKVLHKASKDIAWYLNTYMILLTVMLFYIVP